MELRNFLKSFAGHKMDDFDFSEEDNMLIGELYFDENERYFVVAGSSNYLKVVLYRLYRVQKFVFAPFLQWLMFPLHHTFLRR